MDSNTKMMETQVVSSFFTNTHIEESNKQNITDDFLHLCHELNAQLEHCTLPPTIYCVYNPTIYAHETFGMYVRKYCNSTKPIMYFGMNPGPWGMSQTGVPFGEVSSVRDWLDIKGVVSKPPIEVAARPIKGFDCSRTEISGKRFWGLFKSLCGTPDKFFQTSFVYNYLPQQWLKNNGCNVTPGDLKASEVEELYSICDPIFYKVLELYEVEKIVAVGKFCETRAQKVLKKFVTTKPIQILYMPHPSPRTVNNNNWEEKAIKFLQDSNLIQFYK